MEVRTPTDAELRSVSAMWKGMVAELGPPMMPKQLATLVVLVAVDERGVLGFVNYKHLKRKPQTTIYDIAVHRNARRQGVARALVQRVLSDSPHGCIRLKCIASNPACSFYTRLGFQVERMERSLTGKAMKIFAIQRPSDGV